MDRKALQNDDTWETDPVWKLLDEVPSPRVSPRFVEQTVRAARLAGTPETGWWRKLFSPIPFAAMTAGAAALAVAAVVLTEAGPSARHSQASATTPEDPAERYALIQEAAEAEALIAAVDQLENFSDSELMSLIGL